MKALVLGGNRFFGKRLVSLLIQKGVEVTILNRGRRVDDFAHQVRRICLDRRELTSAHPEIAEQSWDIIYDNICFDASEAKAACETFRGKTSRYIFISSQSVYQPGQKIFEQAFNPAAYTFTTFCDRENDYGEAKRQAEATFFQAAEFPVTAVRFPMVLGEDDYTERLKQHVLWVNEGKSIYFPNIEAKISFIQSSDAAKFLAALAENPLPGPVNCCAREPIALHDVVRTIERIVGKDAIITNNENDGAASPFGIASDWYMNTDRLREFGFMVEPIALWLPSLVKSFVVRRIG